MHRVLVIGIGNPVRGDDAVGCHVAHALEQLYRGDPQVEVMAVHQLTPELTDDVSQSAFVLFLDAASGPHPGLINQTPVSPTSSPGGISHHLTPALLLAAAASLYGDAPTASSLTVVGDSFEVGDTLSPIVAAHIPEMVRHARHIIDAHRPALHPGRLARTR